MFYPLQATVVIGIDGGWPRDALATPSISIPERRNGWNRYHHAYTHTDVCSGALWSLLSWLVPCIPGDIQAATDQPATKNDCRADILKTTFRTVNWLFRAIVTNQLAAVAAVAAQVHQRPKQSWNASTGHEQCPAVQPLPCRGFGSERERNVNAGERNKLE